MKKIGIISDTHSYIDEKLFEFFKNCDEVWHAGDIGNIDAFNLMNSKFNLRAVYGNIDGGELRLVCKSNLFFQVEEVKVLMTHIGGYPKRYDSRALKMIKELQPDLFVCGHSHILKVMYDKDFNMMCINPGAIGKSGFHVVRTAIRFEINKKDLQNLEVLELQRK